jgi:hypothetical protein
MADMRLSALALALVLALVLQLMHSSGMIIPSLVRQLERPDTPAAVQLWAASALQILALGDDNRVAITAAGAIPPLVLLMAPVTAPKRYRVKLSEAATGLLMQLAASDDNQVTIAAAPGAILTLLHLLHNSRALGQHFAAQTLMRLAWNADNRVTIKRRAGIHSLVFLLGPRSPGLVQQSARAALLALGYRNATCMVFARGETGLGPWESLVLWAVQRNQPPAIPMVPGDCPEGLD